MDLTKREKLAPTKVIRFLESPAYVTAEAKLVDVVQSIMGNIYTEIDTYAVDLSKQVVVIRPRFYYLSPDGKETPLAITNVPVTVIKLEELGDSAFDLHEKIIDIGLEHQIENMVEAGVFGIESMNDYLKE